MDGTPYNRKLSGKLMEEKGRSEKNFFLTDCAGVEPMIIPSYHFQV